MKKFFPILALLTAIFLIYTSYQALKVAPTDALQGDVYRIIYYHVPSAWTAFLLFFINFIASVQYLARTRASLQRTVQWVVIAIGVAGVAATFLPQVQSLLPAGMRPSAVATTVLAIPAFYFLLGWLFPGDRMDMLALTAAEVGVVFCTIVLVNGPDLGAAGMGHLVGAGGYQANLHSRFVADLRELSRAAALFEQRPDADFGCGAGHLRGSRRAPGVSLHMVLSHPAPPAGNRGRRIYGSANAAHPLLSWMAFLCFGFLVCWSRFRLEVLRRRVEKGLKRWSH